MKITKVLPAPPPRPLKKRPEQCVGVCAASCRGERLCTTNQCKKASGELK